LTDGEQRSFRRGGPVNMARQRFSYVVIRSTKPLTRGPKSITVNRRG